MPLVQIGTCDNPIILDNTSNEFKWELPTQNPNI